ncbi:MAG: class I SAM-dependent methyltransferase [Candidatus Aenigmarchaeota archaeon]|nr:class I SAM-dependent methyltransferase [Candidatus Aenigmarchaeota archaeon]
MNAKNFKSRSVIQWNKTPCGSSTLKNKKGTREFFEEVIKYRYKVYAPWLRKIISKEDVKNKKLLEVGCGMGADLLEFAKNGAICTGIDLTPNHVSLAKELFKTYGFSARITKCDAESLSFADNSFDHVYSHGVIHHTPNTEKALSEIHRVLKPGGKALIMVYHKNSFAFYGKVVAYHGILKGKFAGKCTNEILSEVIEEKSKDTKPLVKVYSKKVFQNMLKEIGFNISRIYTHHIMNEKRMTHIRRMLPAFTIKPLESRFGWYLIAEVFK